jgi:hypothetical protein
VRGRARLLLLDMDDALEFAQRWVELGCSPSWQAADFPGALQLEDLILTTSIIANEHGGSEIERPAGCPLPACGQRSAAGLQVEITLK